MLYFNKIPALYRMEFIMKSGRKIILLLGNVLLTIALVFFVIALFGEKRTGEAYIGDFDTTTFNENWSIVQGEKTYLVTLPTSLDDCQDTTILMKNTLPAYVNTGMRLCMRSALQEISFYIDGELRESYVGDNFPYVGEHLPSSYIMVDLTSEDAGKEISVHVKISDRSKLNEISIGYGNNAWFSLLLENLPVVVAAIILIIVGTVAVLFYFLLKNRMHFTGAICYLGQIMVIVGLWILSESHIRQLLFESPSYSSIFAYLLLEVLGGFVAMYFDEVQRHKYQKAYLVVEVLVFGQLTLNIILAITGIAEFYHTIIFSHIWLFIGFFVFIVAIFKDIKTGQVQKYSITALGMVIFLVFCAFEMLGYYLKDFHILGKYLCVGLIVLLFSTIIQAVLEEFERIRVTVEREKFQAELEQKVAEQTLELRNQQKRISELFVETVTALCEALDAKDRYTSGHSKRVAEYARMLAARLGKSKEEQDEIYRAGLLHDVGKIRIPAEIINKDGKLTDEEYNIIKIHPVTGYHILRGIAENSNIAIAAKYHHERYDGRGYPNGLSGKNIPEFARILCVADSYDAMASDRSYRKALPQEVVRAEIKKGRGTQFDPHIADIMLEMIAEDTEYALKQPELIQKRLLIIDNEILNHAIITDILHDEPQYDIISATSTADALDLLQKQIFDLILLDISTAETDGMEIPKFIRETYQIPVLLMAKDVNQRTSMEIANLSGEDFITKAFLPLMLKEMVHTMTEGRNY